MSGNDHAEASVQRAVLPPAAFESAVAQRAADAVGDGATCRLGDASCASAHAATVSRWAGAGAPMLHRQVGRLQRRYGNRFVGRVLRQISVQADADAGMATVERSIAEARGGGQPMDHATRGRMQSSFGADFGRVRIHHDARADELGRALSARAFATGSDVFFRQGEYNPGTSGGRELLAHELTHVVQQTGDGISRKMEVSQPGDPQEVEADQMARAVMQHEQQTAQRQPEAPRREDDDEKQRLNRQGDPGAARPVHETVASPRA